MEYSNDLDALNFLTNLSLLAFLFFPIIIVMIVYCLIRNYIGPLWKVVVPYGVEIGRRE